MKNAPSIFGSYIPNCTYKNKNTDGCNTFFPNIDKWVF